MSTHKRPRSGALSCVFCGGAEETKTCGSLLSKDHVTAHLNCLLFSSGIYCRSSPQFDDLFGFFVADVQEEVKRGHRLFCSACGRKGATVGCEVKRCRRSFHYPCAVEAGARPVEDANNEKYWLFCGKHASSSLQTGSGDSLKAGPSGSKRTSPSSSSSSSPPSLERIETPSKRRASASKRIICVSSGEEEPRDEMFAPLEADPDESESSAPEQQAAAPQEVNGSRGEAAAASRSGQRGHQRSSSPPGGVDLLTDRCVPPERQLTAEGREDDIASDTEVRKALFPVTPQADQLTAPADGQAMEAEIQPADEGSARPAPPPSPCCVANGSPRLDVAPPPVAALCSEAGPSIDAATFWKSCNTAGCTRALFDQLMEEVKEISQRIQTEEATQEEYSRALRVMMASGKLAEVVDRQGRELEEQLHELERKSAAMKVLVTSLKR